MELPATKMKKGESGIIKRILGGYNFQHKMRSIGLREGKRVLIRTRQPFGGPLVLSFDGRETTIGRGMARRIIVEICCNNIRYDAENILAETAIAGIDRVLAVTPDKKTAKALRETLKSIPQTGSAVRYELAEVLDAAECLDANFDWKELLTQTR